MKLFTLLLLLAFAERSWKFATVRRFFRRPLPSASLPERVSILQPILSGDPALPTCLEENLCMRTGYEVDFIWLLDEDDADGQCICRELMARYPQRPVQLVTLPPPAADENPKLVKLLAGTQLAQGEIIVVLDDDTSLPDAGLERCLPALDEPGVGLAFGLPFYRSFDNFWSRLVAVFVNSNSLLTYVPYTSLSQPFTINGMFYAMRREVYDDVGGFGELRHTLADDFAVAQHMRRQGYRLVQTPLCHPIRTTVHDGRHYRRLIQRWFIFPRESLMRQLRGRELELFYGVSALPAFVPWLLLLGALLLRRRRALLALLAYLAYDYAIVAQMNRAYLQGATPWRYSWLVPLLRLVFPAQLLAALLSPQRIVWRGHVMQVERGGGFRFTRRRTDV
ncbi:MAG: glycosyltransferase [Chloroflexaceae bacterium]|jgi:ceramide glucosyltransferase|nr:glycosyltransferase [Chloroflexaceae bacterium]